MTKHGRELADKVQRKALYLRAGERCAYCELDLSNAIPGASSLDHIIPQCEGGSEGPDNLVMACSACNCARGSMPVEAFASPEALERIRAELAKDLAPYIVEARVIINARRRAKRAAKNEAALMPLAA